MIKRGAEVRVKPSLTQLYAKDLADNAPYRWIANRKSNETGKVQGPLMLDGTQWVLVIHVGELEAIYRPSELEEVQ